MRFLEARASRLCILSRGLSKECMSIELAEKIKAMAKQQIDTAALVDKLEARIAVLEKFTKPSEPIEYAKYVPSGPVNPILPSTVVCDYGVTSVTKTVDFDEGGAITGVTVKIPEKRGRGRPKKGS